MDAIAICPGKPGSVHLRNTRKPVINKIGNWDIHWEKFDADALAWEIKNPSNSSVQAYTRVMELKFLRNLAVNNSITEVCDFGCGMGIADIIWGKKVSCTLVDNSDSALECARRFHKHFNSKIVTCKGDILSLMPKFSKKFDVVWSQGVLEHFNFSEQVSILKNMAAMTKRNGYVIVMVPNKFNPYTIVIKFFDLLKLFGHKGWRYGYENPLSPEELKKIFLQEPSLRIIKVKGIVPFIMPLPFKNRILNNLLVSVAKIFENSKFAGWFGREIIVCTQKIY